MTIVVSGASGFIGAHVTRELQSRGAEVLAVARSKLPDDIAGVILNDYRETPEGDVLVHLAEPREAVDAEEGDRAHPTRVLDTLESLLKRNFKRIVYGSSALVYGDNLEHPRRPSEPIDPRGPYAQAKAVGERSVMEVGGVVVRIANVYGPQMATTNVVSHVLAQIPGTGPVGVRDDQPIRDYLWVDDAARGLADIALGAATGVFNLGTGTGTSVGDLARMALRNAGESSRQVQPRCAAQRRSWLILDASTTKEGFGWHPRVSLGEGLALLMNDRQ